MKFYTVNNSYVQQLYQVDSEVFFDPVNYDNKPYVGIIVQNGSYDYFIPLTSAKDKHRKWKNISKTNYIIYELLSPDLSDIPSEWVYIQTECFIKHILSVLEIKKMIPVPKGFYSQINFSEVSDKKYRDLLQKEYYFLKPLQDDIFSKARIIYTEQKATGIIHPFHCDFGKLEQIYDSISYETILKI